MRRQTLIAAAFVLLAALFLTSAPLRAETIRLAAPPWCPFACKGEPQGFIIDVAKAILEPAGYRLSVTILPMPDALRGLAANRFDGLVAGGDYGLIQPDEPQYLGFDAYFVRSNSRWRPSPADPVQALSRVRLGMVQGYAVNPDIDAYVAEAQTGTNLVRLSQGPEASRQNLQNLLSGGVDVVIDSEAAVNYESENLQTGAKIRNAGRVSPEPFVIYIQANPISRQGRRLATVISKGMTRLRESGEFQNLLEKYGLFDWR